MDRIGIEPRTYHGRALLLSTGSLAFGALIGIGKLAAGLVFLSPWLIVTAVYYLLLGGARGQLLWKNRRIGNAENPAVRAALQRRAYRQSGVFISLIGLSYFLVCLCMYRLGITTSYPYYIQYGVAAVAFYKIGMAIYGMVVTRKMNNPVLSSLKILNFTDACVSIVAVQNALLTMEESPSASSSSAFLGMGCSVLFLLIGIGMLIRKFRPRDPQGECREDG